MSSTFTVAVLQCVLGKERKENLAKITEFTHKAAEKGANLILPPELFEGPYFCNEENAHHFERAHAVAAHPTLKHFAELSKKLNIAMPISFFEQDGQHYYNSVAMLDADGKNLGVYRKSHIPDGPGYEEKFYFRPGDTGFRVWNTRFAQVGVGICWDQWFPECARAMTLLGADVLCYPTAIGSEPTEPELDTCDPWQRVMIGHAVANAIPVAAANRVGTESGQVFYGSSFIANVRGDMVTSLGRNEEGVVCATFNRQEIQRVRNAFGFFRDRRPELYTSLVEPH